MKSLLIILMMAFVCMVHAQSFATLDGTLYNTEDIRPAWGIDFTGGAFLKNKDDKGRSSFMLGFGVGAYRFTENDLYAPIFMTVGYFNGAKKITPYINFRIGYGFYKGSAKFIGKEEFVKGGLYANVRGGAGFKVTRKFHPTPFIGLTLMMLRKVQYGETIKQYNSALVNAGVCFLFGGK